MLNQFFENVVCLTQGSKPERTAGFIGECEKHGLRSKLFYSLSADTPYKSFNTSQIQILKDFIASDYRTILVLEDDVEFRHLELLPSVMGQLPNDWYMLYLGLNAKPHDSYKKPEYYSENLRKVYNGYATHAVAYTKEAATDIVVNWKDVDIMYDVFLDQNILPKGVFATCPMLARQKPCNSDLWGVDVDYTSIWDRSDRILKKAK